MDLTQVEPQKISTDLSSYTSFLYGPPKAGKTTFYFELFGKNKYGVDNLKEANGGWGAGHKEFSETLFMALNDIESYGYTIHFISHAGKTIEKIPNPDGTTTDTDKYIPSAAKRGMEIATKMVDNVLFAYLGINPETKQEQRVLYTRETLHFQAGTRFKYLQSALPMDAKSYQTAVDAAIQKEGPENLKTEKESNLVQGEDLDFEALMTEAKEKAVEMNKAGRLAEVNVIVEKYLGAGKLMRDATPQQVETVKIIVEELRVL